MRTQVFWAGVEASLSHLGHFVITWHSLFRATGHYLCRSLPISPNIKDFAGLRLALFGVFVVAPARFFL